MFDMTHLEQGSLDLEKTGANAEVQRHIADRGCNSDFCRGQTSDVPMRRWRIGKYRPQLDRADSGRTYLLLTMTRPGCGSRVVNFPREANCSVCRLNS